MSKTKTVKSPSGQPIHVLKISLSPQDKVMEHYKKIRAVKTDHDENALHMFWSPNRVPACLDLTEVRECIEIYPRLKKWRDRMSAAYLKKRTIKLKEALKKPLGLKKLKEITRGFPKERKWALQTISLIPIIETATHTFPLPRELESLVLLPVGTLHEKEFKRGMSALKKILAS